MGHIQHAYQAADVGLPKVAIPSHGVLHCFPGRWRHSSLGSTAPSAEATRSSLRYALFPTDNIRDKHRGLNTGCSWKRKIILPRVLFPDTTATVIKAEYVK